MATFAMIMGLAGSGKSNYCENHLIEYYDAVYISSDAVREALYGNVNDQTHNKEVFETMNHWAKRLLKDDVNIVYDATNLSASRRRALLTFLPPCIKTCYWMDTPIEKCIERDAIRERHVGEKVIRRMANQLEKPSHDEGWDTIIILREEKE